VEIFAIVKVQSFARMVRYRCIYIYIRTYIYLNVCICVYIFIYVYIYIYIDIDLCTYTYIYIGTLQIRLHICNYWLYKITKTVPHKKTMAKISKI
jgi:hypothetical protein